MKNTISIFKSVLKGFRLDPDNLLFKHAYVRKNFQQYKARHNIKMVVFFSLVLVVVEPVSIYLFHGLSVFNAFLNSATVYKKNLLMLQTALAVLAFSYLLFVLVFPLKKKQVAFKTRYFVSMIYVVLGYFGLVCMSVNAQLYRGSIVIATTALFFVGIIFYLNRFFQVLIFLVIGLVFVIMIGVCQQDPMTARINQANFIILSVVVWLFAVYFQNYRLKNYLNYFKLKEKTLESEDDLELAKKIQKGLLPSDMPVLKNFSINYVHESLEQVGGDLVDFINFKESHLLGIFICDVSGHGVSAGLIFSMIKTIIQSIISKKFSPAEFLSELNQRTRHLGDDFYYTAFYGLLDDKEKTMTYARGGHCYPIYFSEGSNEELKSKGHILGVRDSIAIEEKIIHLKKDDSLLLFTDGFYEEENEKGELFESYFKEELCNKELKDMGSLDASKLFKMLYEYKQGMPFKDDVCIVAINVK